MTNDDTTKTDDDAPETVPSPPKKKGGRGFASMDPERVREIASAGGRAAHAAGTAHQWSTEQAQAAGKKGGVAPHVRRGGGGKRRPRNPEST